MKIFATGDVHLGMKFSTYGETRELLADARFLALGRCVEAANAEGCEAFVIAGDLFDRQNISQKDTDRTADILAAFEGQAILILPGNHDFYTGSQNKTWNQLIGRLESRSVSVELLSEGRTYDLEHFDLPLTVFAGPCRSKHSHENAIGWIKDARKAVPDHHGVVGIAHGSIEGKSLDSDGSYFPMTEKQLRDTGINAWIIGHTHLPFPDTQDLNPWLFVPGTPEPDGFDCAHKGGAWIIEVDQPGVCGYHRVDTGLYRFADRALSTKSLDDITSSSIDYNSTTILRLSLSGTLSRDEYGELGAVLTGIREKCLYFREDISGLEEIISQEVVENEFTPESFSYRLLSGLLADGNTRAAQTAYRIIRDSFL